MKIELSKVYRNGVTGQMIRESMLVLSNFTRGARTGGYGMWARRALQGAGLLNAKAYFTSLAIFADVCKSVGDGDIAKMHTNADVKFASSEAEDKGDKSSVARARDAMKTLTCESFHDVGRAVDTLRKAGFVDVEVWVEQADGTDVAIVKPLALLINDIFYRALSISATAKAIAKRGIGDGNATRAKSTRTKKPALAKAA